MKRLFALAAVGLTLLPQQSNADTIGYAVRSTSDDSLYQVNLTAGTVTLIGPVGFSDVEGLSFQPGTGALFGWDDNTAQLIRINLATGAGTAVGPSGISTLDVGLTFDAAGNLYLADENNMGFWSVNPATGAATFIGSTGREITALAELGGVIYGIDDDNDQLVTINPLTGASTLVGNLGIGIGDAGIDFDAQGILWGVAEDGRFFTINTLTGAATVVHAADGSRSGFESLAIQLPAQVAPVPEPATLAVFGALAAGAFGVRRRKAKATA